MQSPIFAPERITAWGDRTTLGIVYKAGPRPMESMLAFRPTEYVRALAMKGQSNERFEAELRP